MSRFINTELESNSDSQSDSESDSQELMAKLKSNSDSEKKNLFSTDIFVGFKQIILLLIAERMFKGTIL